MDDLGDLEAVNGTLRWRARHVKTRDLTRNHCCQTRRRSLEKPKYVTARIIIKQSIKSSCPLGDLARPDRGGDDRVGEAERVHEADGVGP